MLVSRHSEALKKTDIFSFEVAESNGYKSFYARW